MSFSGEDTEKIQKSNEKNILFAKKITRLTDDFLV